MPWKQEKHRLGHEYFEWNDLIFGKSSTAGHRVFTISRPEVCAELQSYKYQYTGCRAHKKFTLRWKYSRFQPYKQGFDIIN